MPVPRNSAASARVRPMTPCLLAQYAAMYGAPPRPAIDEMLTMRPHFAMSMSSMAACVHKNVPGQVRRQDPIPHRAAGARERCGFGDARVVDEDCDRSVRRAARSNARGDLCFVGNVRSRPQKNCGRVPAAAPSGSRRSPSRRPPPAPSAIAKPIPRAPPVTTACLPARSTFGLLLLRARDQTFELLFSRDVLHRPLGASGYPSCAAACSVQHGSARCGRPSATRSARPAAKMALT